MTIATERPTTTWFEREHDRLAANTRLTRMLSWLLPLAVTVLAGVLRLWQLANPHELAFDERYYVKDAWSLWQLGYEGVWDDNANASFDSGNPSGLSPEAGFIVHPPLGKWLIALGMAATGPGSSFGWRVVTALIGTLTVTLVYILAWQLSRSLYIATTASALIAIDGLGIVMSRIALLDSTLTFFLVLGFIFLVKDRQEIIPRLEASEPSRWGPVFWGRPWLVACGFALGLASAVKWSGAYALAVAGIYVVVTDALARRRAGITFWPQVAVFRQGPISFLLLVPAAVVTYLVSWSGWLLTSGGYDRQSSSNPLIALWNYHKQMLGSHQRTTADHPYESAAWEWPLLLRPTAVWVGECSSDDNVCAAISSVPNPLIWYAGVVASLWLVYRLVVNPRWQYAIPLVGLAATYVPWLFLGDRTIFQFYTISMVPFMVIALTFALHEIATRPIKTAQFGRELTYKQRRDGQWFVVGFLALCLALSIFFYSQWTGIETSYEFWRMHQWMPSWI